MNSGQPEMVSRVVDRTGVSKTNEGNGAALEAHYPHPTFISSTNNSQSALGRSEACLSSSANSSGTLTFSPSRLFPIAIPWIERYKRNVVVTKSQTDHEIEPMTRDFKDRGVPGWIPLTHPEGALYFRHERRNIFTDSHLYDSHLLACINAFVSEIDAIAAGKSICLEDGTMELVLELFQDRGMEMTCGYYFIDHSTRCLFWLHRFDASFIFEEAKGVAGPSHMKQEIESQYWAHWEYFPNNRKISPEIVQELKKIMIHATGDAVTSTASTGPYNSEQLQILITLVDSIISSSGKGSESEAWLIGRLMAAFTHHRFLHFYGQHGARLSLTQTVHGRTRQRSPLITLLSPFLFYAPDVHLKSLETLWVDELISLIAWRSFISKLNSEWTEFTLYGTVLLNANVAFLAIPNIASGRDQQSRSPSEIVSYVSIASSVGATILGLLLVRQNRTKSRETADEAVTFLHQMTHPWFHLEILAIMYSLPYALLMWGMLSFLTAVSIMCFSAEGMLTRALAGTVWIIVGALVLWCIWTGWEGEGGRLWMWLVDVVCCRRRGGVI